MSVNNDDENTKCEISNQNDKSTNLFCATCHSTHTTIQIIMNLYYNIIK